jgi:hypothetical protein
MPAVLLLACSDQKPTQGSEEPVSVLKDSANSVDYLIICADSLYGSAQSICSYRKAHCESGIDSFLIVKWSAIKYAFPPSGSSLKRFLSFAFSAWHTPPKYVLLLGSDKVNGDPEQGIPRGDTTYSATVVLGQSDSYYADVNNDGYPDFCLGRIPARIDAEADVVLEKIRNFEDQPHARIAMALDDNCPPWVDFESSYRMIVDPIDSSAFQLDSFRLASYVQSCNWTDSLLALARADFFPFLNSAEGFVCLIGFTGPGQYTDRGLLLSQDTSALTKTGIYIIYGEANRFSHDTCLGKALLFKKGAGAVATISRDGSIGTGEEEAATADVMDALSKKSYPTIGKLFNAAHSTSSLYGVPPRNRILLGDPAMKIMY